MQFGAQYLDQKPSRVIAAKIRRSDNLNVNIGMDFEDLSEGLRISKFIFDLHAGDWAVSTPETESTANKT